MVNLLLVSPQSNQSQGGMTVWTDTFLSHYSESDIACDLLNIATIGSRAQQGNRNRNYADEFVRTKRIFKNLNRMLGAQNYQVAHVNTSCGAFGLIRDYMIIRKIKKRQPQCKIIVHYHCDVQKYTRAKYKRYYLKKILQIVDEALVLNRENKKFLSKISSVKITAVPNFIDDGFVVNQKKVVSDSIRKALFVGYIQPSKGAREIYELARKSKNITFDLIGEVRADVKQWDKPDNVILHGPKDRSEVVKALDEADVFVFPTYSEGFSMALLESMARGLPSITTSVGANSEMLEGKGGVVVSVGDVAAMEAALNSIQDMEKRKQMSLWNVQKVRSEYTASAVMKKITKLYT